MNHNFLAKGHTNGHLLELQHSAHSPSLHRAVSAAAASSMLELLKSLCIWFTSMNRNSWFGDSVRDAVR